MEPIQEILEVVLNTCFVALVPTFTTFKVLNFFGGFDFAIVIAVPDELGGAAQVLVVLPSVIPLVVGFAVGTRNSICLASGSLAVGKLDLLSSFEKVLVNSLVVLILSASIIEEVLLTTTTATSSTSPAGASTAARLTGFG